MSSTSPTRITDIFRQRVFAAADALELSLDGDDSSTAELLLVVVARARQLRDARSAWIMFSCIAGCFPDGDEVLDLRRRLELARSDEEGVAELLEATRDAAATRGVWNREVRIVRGGIVVDVNFSAKNEHNTGIQRLVRETISRWVTSGVEKTLVVWDHEVMTRELFENEVDRVSRWADPERRRLDTHGVGPGELVLPIDSKYFVTEVPIAKTCAALAALAEYSGNHVSLVGYDAIPLVSADLVPAEESEKFARYLSFVKHADRVFGISAAAAGEFEGFAAALVAQGLAGPTVSSIPLPVDLPDSVAAHAPQTGLPLVLCVGSHEPRKNQEALLQAARLLWRDGLEFELVFVGRGDAKLTTVFDRQLAELRKQGHRVESRRSVRDDELLGLYHSAIVTVFASLHEGYGLPVAESLAAGTPVITSNYGSTAEIGADGGCVLIDPRDDAQLYDALKRVLTDQPFVEDLRQAIGARAHASWDDYAASLWDALAEGSAK